MAKKSKSTLSNADELLWKKVTDTVTPRPGLDKASDDDLLLTEMGKSHPTDTVKNRLKATAAITLPQPSNATIEIGKTSGKKPLPPLYPMGKKQKSKISRGLTHIDGRLDLHGMTQREAYDALHRFIRRASANEWKTILVITGKGKSSNSLKTDFFSDIYTEPPGVLRRRVPEWLGDKTLRQFVIGFETAGLSHGGSGALYVRLRKNKIDPF